ncbi:uncharacterized protein LOC125240471 [Leguminivora glycinivorella]|uniref:uncharacterized protein LOC125240471 n=1 Tax=Leguminivora glycinivorella TaxID=1035111 RepID=UPI00200F69BB|nr:uncharacterized protein LOC125240471 [Leguminivora glycinivorella]
MHSAFDGQFVKQDESETQYKPYLKMSSRNVRKVFGDNRLPEPCEDSDDDFEPLYAKNTASKFTYEGLELSSHSEKEQEPSESESVEEVEPQPETSKKKNKRKKKKQKKAKEAAKVEDGEDEIDKSLKEINALMGAPPAAAPAASQELPPQTLIPDVLLVQQKHLNVANEMKKMFGAEPAEERNKRGNRQAQLRIKKKPSLFRLSMSMTRKWDGCAHFTFDHSKEYRHMHQRLLHLVYVGRRQGWPQAAIEEEQRHMHVEAMLESADMLFQIEEYTAANTLVERAIAYMQFVAHPSFQLADPRTRLLYAYMENRTFHVAVLKYIHLLTNRACHRTALELAKMLLNLDPSDPLAVLLVIDTLALRAREHQWLIDAVDHWAKERDAGFLFSIQYSYAMAHFHVATKNKEDTGKADGLLQAAMLRFPAVVLRLLECASAPPGARLQACALFATIAETKITKNLKELILLYAKLTWSKWREPAVFDWLQRNANEIAEKYDKDPATQERAKALANEQLNLFRSWPDEVIRHLCVIKPMANLLVDGAVPQVTNLVSADPSPPLHGVNRYRYTFGPPAATSAHSDLRLLFDALLPTYADLPQQPDTAIFCIIATEFCERFSFCGLRTILSLYLRNVLCLHENAATVVYHIFIMLCYTMPLAGAILADNFLGRYKVILYFSIIYFFGTILTCCSAIPLLKLPPTVTSMIGLALIAAGTGCVKPCVAAFGGEQFRLPEEERQLQRFFSTFYCTVNLGGFMGMVLTPALRRGVMCFGDDTCYALGFGFPTVLVLLSIFIFAAGKSWYRIKEPRENVTLKFVACAWYAAKKRLRESGTPPEHWLDYSINKYGSKLVEDMKIVFSILYLYLPVPIFWSLFDQQGSRWTFQASRLRSELFGLTLMPDQLQVLNPALVLLLIPVCPGGACPLLPELPPLTKMFIGGMLAAMAFFAAGILQVGIERSTLQAPGRHHSGLVVLSTLACPVELTVRGAGAAGVLLPARGSALLTPLPHAQLALHAACARSCDGRHMRQHEITTTVRTVAGLFTPVVIGQDSDDHISFHFMDPNAFSKSLSGKPKLKVVYVGETEPNRNVTLSIESDKQLVDIYYVSDSPVNNIAESAYMHLAPGRYRWRAEHAGGALGAGCGTLRAGGVYVLSARARRGRLDSVQLHAPNPPNELHLAWLLPQYLLISCAEILFAVSGLEFSFTQAPKSMKTITIAAWYMSVAVGNFIVILVAQTKVFESRATEFFVYATVLTIAMLSFLKMAQGYEPRSLDEDYSEESALLLKGLSKMLSVRSATTSSTFAGAASAASCLGRMERAPPGAWPPRAHVHLATPTDSDVQATTLAKN